MSEPRSRRWFLGTAAGAVPAVALRPRPRRRRAAYPAAAEAGGSVPVTVVSTGTFNAPPPGFPDGTTTGYLNAPGYPGSLTDGSSLTIQSNTTYSFVNFPGGVALNAGVHDVTFVGCRFLMSGGVGTSAFIMLGTNANPNFSWSYCTFAPAGIAPYGPPGGVTIAQSYQFGLNIQFNTGKINVDHCDLWGFGNAIVCSGGSQASQHTFTDNYIHDACQDFTYHTDGLGMPPYGTSAYDVIHHNTINSIGNTQALAYENSPGPSTWDHFTITNNLFGGFGFTVNVINGTNPGASLPPTNITFTDNTLTTQFLPIFGPLYDDGISRSSSGNLWRRNLWHVPPGAQWGHAQYDGYFWLPKVFGNTTAATDELAVGFVSLTDFTG